MSYLRKYARPSIQNKTRQYNVKLPDDIADQFEALCRQFNLTHAEAIRYLIIEEVERFKREEDTKGYPEIPDGSQKIVDDTGQYIAVTREVAPKQPNPKKSRSRSSSGGGRFDTIQWQISGKTACPICRTWQSAANFSRHAKTQHDMTAKEIFVNPEYVAIADRMVEERKKDGF